MRISTLQTNCTELGASPGDGFWSALCVAGCLTVYLFGLPGPVYTAAPTVIQPRLVDLRNDATREWSSLPAQPDAAFLENKVTAEANAGEFALRLRQQDVKQGWRVLLNGQRLGEL